MAPSAGDRFVSMPAEAIFAFLEARGFSRVNRARREVVFERAHDKDRRFKVLVYTSVSSGKSFTRARARGADAIRVCAIFEEFGRASGIAKLPKILRTAPPTLASEERVAWVLERVLGRMREAYKACSRRSELVASTRPPLPGHCGRDPSPVGACGGTDACCSCECHTCEDPNTGERGTARGERR